MGSEQHKRRDHTPQARRTSTSRPTRQSPRYTTISEISHQLQRTVGNRAVHQLFKDPKAAGRDHARPHLGLSVDRYETREHVSFGATAERVTVAGSQMSQGEMIAMGDFFRDVAQMEQHPRQVREVLTAIRNGQATTAGWQRATGGRYLELALDNEAHFAPSNATLVRPSARGQTNHYVRFRQGHADALILSAASNANDAQARNSFAGHFLTDAFAAGHIINKADVMAQFRSRLSSQDAFLDRVANAAWRDPRVRATMSIREPTGLISPNFDSVGMFRRFLRGVADAKPDALFNGVALAVHDELNALAADPSVGGLEVENNRGDSWRLSGDGTLAQSPQTLTIAQAAVGQSNSNLAAVRGIGTPLITDQLVDQHIQSVWDHVPRPTAQAGTLQVATIVNSLTNPANPQLVNTLAAQLAGNIDAIAAEAEELGRIRVEPPGALEEIRREGRRALDWREWYRLTRP